MKIKTKQIAGFTLIELMVGVILSSLFIGGISQIFTRTTQSFKTQKTISNIMEDARFILDILNKETRRSGFLSNRLLVDAAGTPIGDADTLFHDRIAIDYSSSTGTYGIRNNGDVTPGNLFNMGLGEFVEGEANSETTNSPPSDSLIIRYQLSSGDELTDNPYSSCTRNFSLTAGETNADQHVITIVFYMKKNATVESNVLYCRAARENLDTGDFVQLNSEPLISNVERFRVLYAESNGAGIAYRSYDQVTDWADVLSARLSLALKSEDKNITPADSPDYVLNGKLSITPLKVDEKRVYRVFSTTVSFRNNT